MLGAVLSTDYIIFLYTLYMKAQVVAVRHALSAGGGAAKSYPMSEVRNSGPECQAVTVQKRPGGATQRPRSGAVTLRSHPKPRPGPAAGRSNPRSGG